MGKSMSLFSSGCLITYEISILKLFYLLGVCNCNRLFLLDINEKYMYVQYVRVLLSAKDRGLAAAPFWCWATRGSCITIATYRHQPSLFWLLCATNIPSVWGETQASYAFGKSPRSTSGGCWLRQASSVSEEPGDLCWILPDMEVGYNVGIVEMPIQELYFGIAVLDLNDW